MHLPDLPSPPRANPSCGAAGDGKCVVCDSYVRPCTLVRICDECNYGSFEVSRATDSSTITAAAAAVVVGFIHRRVVSHVHTQLHNSLAVF